MARATARRWIYATVLLLVVGFAVDVLTTATLGGLVYVAAVLLCALTPARVGVLTVAAAATLLGVIDRIPLAVEGALSPHDVAERSAVLMAIWMITALVRQRSRDVSERTAAQRAAQSYLDLVEVLVVALDRDARITTINRAGCQLLGVGEGAVVGESWIDRFVPPEDRARVRALFANVLEEAPEAETVENEIQTASGDRRLLLWRNAALRGADGEAIGTLSSGMDITELRAAEDALERARDELRDKENLARLGEMAAVVAHEVKNPLAGLRSTLQILEGRAADGSSDREIIATMIRRIDVLNRIVDELLSFARPAEMHRALVDCCDLVRDAVAVGSRDVQHVEVDGARCLVDGDASQLERALLNLLLNAVQASSGDPGSVTVRVEPVGTSCEIRVRDDGPGIPDDIRGRAFDPFVTSRSQGTGLGLTITRRIVEAHGGTVTLGDAPGGGTEAVIRLPRLLE